MRYQLAVALLAILAIVTVAGTTTQVFAQVSLSGHGTSGQGGAAGGNGGAGTTTFVHPNN